MRAGRAGLLREKNVEGEEGREKDEGTIDAVSNVAELPHEVRDIHAVRLSPANKDIRDSNLSRRCRDLRLHRTRPLRKDRRSVKAEVVDGEGEDGGEDAGVGGEKREGAKGVVSRKY